MNNTLSELISKELEKLCLDADDYRKVIEEVLKKKYESNLHQDVKVHINDQGHVTITASNGEYVPQLPELGKSILSTLDRSISRALHQAHQEKEYDLFQEQIGDLFSCTVKRVDGAKIFVVYKGKHHGILIKPFRNTFVRYVPGSKLLCRLEKIERSNSDVRAQLYFERWSKEFIYQLLSHVIPDVESGLIHIKDIVRCRGLRTTVAVHSDVVNPISKCVGSNAKVHKILVEELKQETLDFALWKQDFIDRVYSYSLPVRIVSAKSFSDQELHITVANEDDKRQLRGFRGSKIQSLTQLLGLDYIHITTSEESNQQSNFAQRSMIRFLTNYGISNDGARYLVQEFKDLECLLYVGSSETDKLSEKDFEIAQQLAMKRIEIFKVQYIKRGNSESFFDLLVQNCFTTTEIEYLENCSISNLNNLKQCTFEDLVKKQIEVDTAELLIRIAQVSS